MGMLSKGEYMEFLKNKKILIISISIILLFLVLFLIFFFSNNRKEKMNEMLEDAEKRGIKVKTYEQSLAEDLLSNTEDKLEEGNQTRSWFLRKSTK